jgi:hypothetical protein
MLARIFCVGIAFGAGLLIAAPVTAACGHHRDAMLLWLGPLCAVAFVLIVVGGLGVVWREKQTVAGLDLAASDSVAARGRRHFPFAAAPQPGSTGLQTAGVDLGETEPNNEYSLLSRSS